MHGAAEWRRFFSMVCECAALDAGSVRLDQGFKEILGWIPPQSAPGEAMQLVLEVMSLHDLAAWLQPSPPVTVEVDHGQAHAVPDRPRSNREGKRKMSEVQAQAHAAMLNYGQHPCANNGGQNMACLFSEDGGGCEQGLVLPWSGTNLMVGDSPDGQDAPHTRMSDTIPDYWHEVDAASSLTASGSVNHELALDTEQLASGPDEAAEVVVCTDSDSGAEGACAMLPYHPTLPLAETQCTRPEQHALQLLQQARKLIRTAAARAVHGGT